MNNTFSFVGIIASFIFLGLICMFGLFVSAMILALLNQFLKINLFFYIDSFPVGVFVLMPVIVFLFFRLFFKEFKNK